VEKNVWCLMGKRFTQTVQAKSVAPFFKLDPDTSRKKVCHLLQFFA